MAFRIWQYAAPEVDRREATLSGCIAVVLRSVAYERRITVSTRGQKVCGFDQYSHRAKVLDEQAANSYAIIAII